MVKKRMGLYKNCISLGWFCGVASSMSRYGLRGHSGPFDWCYSDFKSVLEMMETHFSDFMIKENLSVETDDKYVFYDNKYGFRYLHDVQHDFEKEYSDIYQKYVRRIERFMQNIKQPTLFIRAVRSEEEIAYIEENREYIYGIIRKENPDNEIAFLILNGMTKLSNNFLCFRLNIERYRGVIYEMRMMFDSSDDFSKFCKKYILSQESIIQNKDYDKKYNKLSIGRGILGHSLDVCNSDIEFVLKKYYPVFLGGIYLWGAGTYGIPMLRHLIKKGIVIKGIIDNDTGKIGTLCEGVPIMPFSKIEDDGQSILIAIPSDIKAAAVQKQILDAYPDTQILKYNDLCDKLFEEFFESRNL